MTASTMRALQLPTLEDIAAGMVPGLDHFAPMLARQEIERRQRASARGLPAMAWPIGR